MGSMHCRLYDENLVHNIIMSTGMAVVDFMTQNRDADADEVCEYLELHADAIIKDTIEQMNDNEEYPEKDTPENPWFPPGERPEL